MPASTCRTALCRTLTGRASPYPSDLDDAVPALPTLITDRTRIASTLSDSPCNDLPALTNAASPITAAPLIDIPSSACLASPFTLRPCRAEARTSSAPPALPDRCRDETVAASPSSACLAKRCRNQRCSNETYRALSRIASPNQACLPMPSERRVSPCRAIQKLAGPCLPCHAAPSLTKTRQTLHGLAPPALPPRDQQLPWPALPRHAVMCRALPALPSTA